MRAILLLALTLPLWGQNANVLACVKTGPESLVYSAMARTTWSQGTVVADLAVSDGEIQNLKLSGGSRLLQLTVGQLLEKWTFSTDCEGPLQLRFVYTLRGAVRTERSPQTILVPPNTFWILDNPVYLEPQPGLLTQTVK